MNPKSLLFIVFLSALMIIPEFLAEQTNEVTNDEKEVLSVLEMLDFCELQLLKYNLSKNFIIARIDLMDGNNGKYGHLLIDYVNKTKPHSNTTAVGYEIWPAQSFYGGGQLQHNINLYETHFRGVKQIPLKNPTFNLDSDEALQIALSHPQIKKFTSSGIKNGLDPRSWDGVACWMLSESLFNESKYGDLRFCYVFFNSYTSNRTYSAAISIDVETGEVLYVEVELEDMAEESIGHIKYYITGIFFLILIIIIVFYIKRRKRKQRFITDD